MRRQHKGQQTEESWRLGKTPGHAQPAPMKLRHEAEWLSAYKKEAKRPTIHNSTGSSHNHPFAFVAWQALHLLLSQWLKTTSIVHSCTARVWLWAMPPPSAKATLLKCWSPTRAGLARTVATQHVVWMGPRLWPGGKSRPPGVVHHPRTHTCPATHASIVLLLTVVKNCPPPKSCC